MTIHNVRLPEAIEQGATGGAGWNTSVVTTSGGRERRQINWSQALRRWNLASGMRTRTDIATLLSFWHARQGRAYGFLFKDWSDFAMSRQSIGSTDGSDATWQIYKRYTSGGVNHDRTLTRIVSGTVSVWVNNVAITAGGGGSQYAINVSTGVITLGATLAATTGQAIEVACEFDIPVRFDMDDMELELRTYASQRWANISIVEVRE